MRQFRRADRLGGQILRDISQLLDAEMSRSAYGMVTFTRVRLSNDLRHAKVYYSVLGTDEQRTGAADYLEKHKKQIRSQVGRGLHVRHIPELEFVFDPSVEEGIRIEQLFNEINRERKKE